MKEYNIAILGATGAVGRTMIKILEERNFPIKDLKLFASSASVGKIIRFKNKEIPVQEITNDSFVNLDIVFGAVGNDLAKKFAPEIVKSGAIFIDNSSAFRLQDDIPLIIPEINPEDVQHHNGIIANPNCATIIGLMACYPIHKINPIKKITVSTYQAVSGAGNKGIDELEDQTYKLSNNQKNITFSVFPQQIAFNLIPQIGEFEKNGYSKEEMKFVHESRKILHSSEFEVNCTCVRVPVIRCHSESITLECTNEIELNKIKNVLKKFNGIKLYEPYPTPLECNDQDLIYVGRIRKNPFNSYTVNLWCCGDQLRKGAATNAIQIAELLIHDKSL